MGKFFIKKFSEGIVLIWMGYKFRTSKLDKLNKKFRKKPYKYVYKEIFPRKVFEKIQKKIYYRTQKKILKLK